MSFSGTHKVMKSGFNSNCHDRGTLKLTNTHGKKSVSCRGNSVKDCCRRGERQYYGEISPQRD